MQENFHAVFYDGRSAAGHSGTVTLGPDALDVMLDDGTAMRWRYADLALVSGDGNRVVVARDSRSDERLTITGADAWPSLLAAAPRLGDQRPTRGFRTSLLVVGGIFAVLAIAWLGYPRLKDGLVAVFPDSWSDRIGEEMAADQALFGQPCTGKAGLAALDGLARRLSTGAGLPEPIKVHVRSSDQINAFAATGGHIAVLDGLIQQARTPEEVAGVLAHEIGHVRHRHPLKRLIDVAGIQLVVTGISGDVGAVGTMILMLNYGRRDEAQADRTGIDLLDRAGIAAGGLADFFDRMAAQQVGNVNLTGFLHTHPPLAERSAMIRAHKPSRAVTPALTDQEWRDVRAVCVGAAPATDEPAE